MTAVDLNSDLGESFGAYKIGDDTAMLSIVSSANIACGFHGGDPLVMHETIRLARENGVGIGAHPGFNDLWGFGRRSIQGDRPEDLEKQLVYQVGAIKAMAASLDSRVGHFKLHGALYNMAATDEAMAMAAARAVRAVDRDMIFVVLPGSEMERAGEKLNLRIAREIFADRAYRDDGLLVSRKDPDAMIEDADEAARRMVDFVQSGEVESINGKRIPVSIDTICVHGDNAHAVGVASTVQSALVSAGISVRSMVEAIGGVNGR